MRAIPDNNLAYPALVEVGPSCGSGFLLNTGTFVYLVTAAHVVTEVGTGRSHGALIRVTTNSPDPTELDTNIFEIDLQTLAPGFIRRHPARDLILVLILKKAPKANDPGHVVLPRGVRLVQASKGGLITVDFQNTKRFDEVLIGNDVVVFGYPRSIGIVNFPQLDHSRPLLRKGIVAGSNRVTGNLVLDCPVYPGNSGGPVLEIEPDGLSVTYRVVGVVIQFVPHVATVALQNGGSERIESNSGYSIAAPMDQVFELSDALDQSVLLVEPAV